MTDYTYDAAGNMKTDANKGLEIMYNYLNLPSLIKVADGRYLRNYYVGSNKVRTEVLATDRITVTKTTDYVAGMVYVHDGTASKLDFIATPEGRYLLKEAIWKDATVPVPQGDKGQYEYSLKDHLGNLRVSCRCGEPMRDETGKPTAGIIPLAVVQNNEFDPWGLAFGTATDNQKPTGLTNDYKYNGKELIDDLPTGLYAYGFRYYDPGNARFIQVDPLANDYQYKSVYDYAENDPVSNIDLDGLEKYSVIKAMTDKNTKEALKRGSEAQGEILEAKVSIMYGVKGNFKIMGRGFEFDAAIENNEFALKSNGAVSYENDLLKAGVKTKISDKIDGKIDSKLAKYKINSDGSEEIKLFEFNGQIAGKKGFGDVQAKSKTTPTFEIELPVFSFDGVTITAGLKSNLNKVKESLTGYSDAVKSYVMSVFTNMTNNSLNTDGSGRSSTEYINEEKRNNK